MSTPPPSSPATPSPAAPKPAGPKPAGPMPAVSTRTASIPKTPHAAAPDAAAPDAGAAGASMAVAVVVVTWNSAGPLPGLLESLDAGLAGLAWQLIIVDNDSADDSVALAQRLAPGCRVVQTGRNAGYSAGINAGLAAADRFDAALVLNPDIRLAPGSAALLAAELADPVGIVVPRIRNEDGSVARSLRREPTLPRAIGEALLGGRAGRYPYLGETVLDDEIYQHPATADWATGAVLLISADCLARCGAWDESFFLYSEETDFALRARDQGLVTRYLPAAEVTHLGGESSVSPRLWSLLTINRVRLYRKRHSAPATGLYWTAVFAREAARAALGKPRSKQAVRALLRPSTVDMGGAARSG